MGVLFVKRFLELLLLITQVQTEQISSFIKDSTSQCQCIGIKAPVSVQTDTQMHTRKGVAVDVLAERWLLYLKLHPRLRQEDGGRATGRQSSPWSLSFKRALRVPSPSVLSSSDRRAGDNECCNQAYACLQQN